MTNRITSIAKSSYIGISNGALSLQRKTLMRIYKDLELVEHLGSGLNRILKAYGKESFMIKENYMKNIFYSNTKPIDVGVNEVYEYIQQNQPLKATKISQYFPEVTKRTIERWLKQLKIENKIEFIGSPKTGGYFAK